MTIEYFRDILKILRIKPFESAYDLEAQLRKIEDYGTFEELKL